ncbi:sodium:proton antiporter [Holophaga foetida]|uniref:sodium:proton antiporter n=1 Tax=Holophaga foetida TaxID=35839 RepID=UPI0002475013|nr:sodium:proton antiporter [Holophaga foetida]
MPTHQLVVPLYAVLPFVLMLACIAILPLAAPHWWDHNRNKGIVAVILAAPIAVWLLSVSPTHLLHVGIEYASFICLLGSLFVVAGGIHIGGDLRATPRNNTIMLGIGAVLASVIGTTGASMVLIRLLLRTNSERERVSHIPFFFILLVSNAGGLLTPLGDPPLFLGFLRGVPFFWTMRLFPIWLIAIVYLLAVFYFLDRRAYTRETPPAIWKDDHEVEPLSMDGRLNLLWLLVIVLAVFIPTPYREIVMVASAIASLKLGSSTGRTRNEFNFGPIIEVAILFIGIFVTMAPALTLLEHTGPSLGLTKPWHFFLVSGGLSSVLDNAPTYLTFFTTAQATASSLGLPTSVVGIPANLLAAISAGSVLMGANTYIGNGPNFMVKSIAESAGYRMPSFFRYAVMAIAVLLPIYLVTAWIIPSY